MRKIRCACKSFQEDVVNSIKVIVTLERRFNKVLKREFATGHRGKISKDTTNIREQGQAKETTNRSFIIYNFIV
jgi:hypothetical protein